MKECMPADKPIKYNYIIFNVKEDYLKPFFFPLRQNDHVQVYEHAFDGKGLIQKLFFLHWSAKLNQKFRLPLKSLWFRKMCKKTFPTERPCCYLFIGNKYLGQEKKLYRYIKKLDSRNKAGFYFLDLVSKKNLDLASYKTCSDFILTYDRSEAEQYQIRCFDELIYGAISDVTEPEDFAWDVYFLGFAKDRLTRIHDVYHVLTKAGLRCKFIICGTKPEDRISGEGLSYQDPISYAENIENVKKSRCILELMQGGSDAPTLRTQEAITYKRKLLTDHLSAASQSYFNAGFMKTFSEAEQIDTAFAGSPIDYAAFDDRYDLSPNKLIAYLENLLE